MVLGTSSSVPNAFPAGRSTAPPSPKFRLVFSRRQHPDFRHCLFYGLLLPGEIYGLLEQPCGNVLALGDKGALAPLEDGEHLFMWA